MQTDSRRRNPKVAAVLGLVAGPLGFLYVGWRYALAGTVVFGAVIGVSALLLRVPSWLIYANLPVFAFLAYTICETLNGIEDKGPSRSTLASNTLPVAVFAMTRALPLIAAVSAGAMGVTTAFSQLTGGHVGGALLMAALVTPIFVVASIALGALIAVGIDHGVLRLAPNAPRHIFPPLISIGE
jgi:hypothetical protein